MGQRILVTGGAGYIGSHACQALKAAGHEPIALDNLVTGWRDSVQFGPFISCDLTDAEATHAALRDCAPDAVMHFAALSDVGQSMREPGLYWKNNVLGSLNLLNAMADADVQNLVFSSTCATYGEHDGLLLDEACPQKPINAYGASKLAVEHMIANYSACRDLRAVIFRYFNVAGADPAAQIGEFHRPETHLIPIILDAIIGRREALTINGTDYPTTDGTCVRDYVHVTDLIAAHIAGLDYLRHKNGVSAFNLGTGHGFSVREVMAKAAEVTGRPVPHLAGPRRAGDCASLVSGSARALETLGWQPRRSTLQHMIADAWAWHQSGAYER